MLGIPTAWVLLLAGCTTNPLDLFEVCDLELELVPDAAAPGEVVTATGGPFTEVRDTIVMVGGFEAEVLSVSADLQQTGDTAATDLTFVCEECETCRIEAGCGPCGSCAGERLEPSRRLECFGDPLEGTIGACDLCEQQVDFVVPLVGSGATTVWMVNRNGTSPSVPFSVLGVPGTGDTSSDTGTPTTPTGTTGSTGSTGSTGGDTGGSTGDTAGPTGATADTATAPPSPTADTSDTGS